MVQAQRIMMLALQAEKKCDHTVEPFSVVNVARTVAGVSKSKTKALMDYDRGCHHFVSSLVSSIYHFESASALLSCFLLPATWA